MLSLRLRSSASPEALLLSLRRPLRKFPPCCRFFEELTESPEAVLLSRSVIRLVKLCLLSWSAVHSREALLCPLPASVVGFCRSVRSPEVQFALPTVFVSFQSVDRVSR